MSARAIDESVGGKNIIWEILFDIVCMLFCVLARRKTVMSINGKWLVVFLVYILLISIMQGYTIGFHKQSAILLYVQPILLFFVEYYAQQDEMIRRITPFVVKALAGWILFLFFDNYQMVRLANMQSYYTTNSSYYLLYFLPMFLLFLKEKYRRYIFLVVLVVVVLSSKRAGLLSLLLGFLSYSYAYSRVKKTKGFIRIAILSLILYYAFILINNYMGNIVIDRFETISEDEGSGRMEIWTVVWSMILESDFLHSLFGHGYSAVITDSGTGYSAHNDYLEVLYDFGWVGLVLFIGVIVSWFVHAVKLMNLKLEIAPILMMAVFVFITSCIFSHIVIYTLNFNLFTLFFGAFIGIEKRAYIIQNRSL